MKRVLGLLGLVVSLSACAQHQHHNGHRHYSSHDWLVPAAIGGLVVYSITKQNERTAPPVVVEQYQFPNYQNCTEWREVFRNGVRMLERTCFNR